MGLEQLMMLAGKELLSFLASHQQSWQHPRTRQWSSIDYYSD